MERANPSSIRRGGPGSRTGGHTWTELGHDVGARLIGKPPDRGDPLRIPFPDDDLDFPSAPAALGAPDRVCRERRGDAHDVVRAPRPERHVVEDDPVSRRSCRQPIDADDHGLVDFGHSNGSDQVGRLACCLAGETGRSGRLVDRDRPSAQELKERRSAQSQSRFGHGSEHFVPTTWETFVQDEQSFAPIMSQPADV